MAAGTALRVCICMPRQLAEFGDRVASSCGALSGAIQFTKCEEDSAGNIDIGRLKRFGRGAGGGGQGSMLPQKKYLVRGAFQGP